ncbi:Serine 3-dehydrogenase [Hartmannibacter diazotrophicus]|uniref:Serine 3-dehydrogenase n=1 Tax=Hartmannibacter diazotrophicus TaxID=1482074 RepID=A0A2C9D8N0_9HYPH|nr:SDR family oxidoreductase [Hartmannibacter diazotrophicus]SON56682.1 Serine 3-dehydrogenase [Hartmannibacter diazotrophicus]
MTTKTTALITGASSGIGALYADRFAARGHDLIIVARNEARLTAHADALSSRYGVSVRPVVADLTDPAQLREVEAILATDANIEFLINNAGFGSAAPLTGSPVDEMERMIAINATAPMRLTYAAVPQFLARGRGTIINIASIVAIAPEILNGVYGGSKSFILAFSHSLRKELADTPVRVQVVLPGATGTEFWDVAGLPVDNLPKEWVMPAAALVDAALFDLDRGEYVSIPSLMDEGEYLAFEAARQKMLPHLSNSTPADRYRAAV